MHQEIIRERVGKKRESVRFITYKGKKILFVDYSNCTTKQEILSILNKSKKTMLNNRDIYLMLVDVTDLVDNFELIQEAKNFVREIHDRRIRKTAAIGVSGIKKIIFSAINMVITPNKLPVAFDKNEEALEWLVS